MSEEERKYYESEAKRKWQKNNTVVLCIKLQKKGDWKMLKYLEEKEKQGFSKGGLFKEALKKQMEKENWTEDF